MGNVVIHNFNNKGTTVVARTNTHNTSQRLVIPSLEYTSEEDLHRAAEAVLEAAVCCYEEQEIGRLYKNEREALVDAVLRDPEVTGKLFRGGEICLNQRRQRPLDTKLHTT